MIQFDQKIWKQKFISNKVNTSWKCGYCGIGGLQLKEQIKTQNSTTTVFVTCTDPHCRKQYCVVGNVKAMANNIDVGFQYFKIDDYKLYPTHFQPEVILFELPLTLNEEVKIQIDQKLQSFLVRSRCVRQ